VICYDVAGRVSLGVVGNDEPALTTVARQMDPLSPTTAPTPAPDVVLDLTGSGSAAVLEVHNPARDGTTTAWDGRDLRLLAGRSSCAVRGLPEDSPLTLSADPDFPLGTLFRRLIRPALQTSSVRHGAVAVHSAAVEVDGRAVLVAGWSETGKTETALALMEGGARWISDKWTLVGTDREASTFPVNVGVRRWVLPYLPRLASSLPRSVRAQVAVAGAVALTSRPLRRRGSRSGLLLSAAEAADRAVGLVDRAALTQSQIRQAYGQTDDPVRRVPLGGVVLLSSIPEDDVSIEAARPEWAADRLALSGAYERHDWYLLQDRLRYADPSAVVGAARQRAVDAERGILARALDEVPLLSVRAPFPVDPRRVADAVRAAM
jgi:hypothetical protein